MKSRIDGFDALVEACNSLSIDLPALVAATAMFVSPRVYRICPVWYPERRRGQQTANTAFTRLLSNRSRESGHRTIKSEQNIWARKALLKALGITGRSHPNWAACHIWGYTDKAYASLA